MVCGKYIFPEAGGAIKVNREKNVLYEKYFFQNAIFQVERQMTQILPLTLTAYSNGFWLYFRETHTHIQTETTIFKKRYV